MPAGVEAPRFRVRRGNAKPLAIARQRVEGYGSTKPTEGIVSD